MIIPMEVIYTTLGRKLRKTREVVGANFPTALAQSISNRELEPISINLGDVEIDWEIESAGYKMYINKRQERYNELRTDSRKYKDEH